MGWYGGDATRLSARYGGSKAAWPCWSPGVGVYRWGKAGHTSIPRPRPSSSESRRQGTGRAAPSRSPWRRAAGALGTRPARTHRPGVRRPGLSVRGGWGRPEHRRGGRGYGAGQHIAAGCSLSAGSAARRVPAGALRSRRPSCSGSPSGGATPPARCGQGRAPRRPRSRRSRSSSSGAANGRPQNAGGGRALPRRRASCTYLSRL